MELFNSYTNVWDSSDDWTYNINSERSVLYGIQFKHIPPYISLHVFHLHMFSPRSAATISLANAVVVIGGHSDGARVSTIGKLKKIFHMNMELL